MIDKIQKIRKEVERLMYGFNLEADVASGEDAEAEKLADIKYQLCKKILEYIDSLKKEPKFEIGDVVRFKGNETIEGEEETRKIVGYDNELYVFDDGTTDLFSEEDLYELVKEPISEDLEEAADNALSKVLNIHEIVNIRSCLEMFRFGAQWQRKQDQSTIELAEDHAMLAGMEKMKEEMMAKAIDVEVKVDAGGYPYVPRIELYDYDKDIPLAKEGDKYKVILVEED